MQRSIRRILTTHTGSLPRPDDLLALVGQIPCRILRENARNLYRLPSG